VICFIISLTHFNFILLFYWAHSSTVVEALAKNWKVVDSMPDEVIEFYQFT
jgi:uncharacterized membrane protein YwzB